MRMSPYIPLRIKILIVGVTVLLLLLVNPFGRKTGTKLENDFDSWLSASKGIVSRPGDSPAPALAIRLRSRSFSWEVQTKNGNRDWNEKILRLLRQAREANLFRYGPDRPGELVLEVKEDTKSFVSHFNETEIRNNVKAAIFLKLFEEYASEQKSLPGDNAAS